MKVYKKLATLAPIAVLSTSIFCLPNMTFAEENGKIAGKEGTTQQNVGKQDSVFLGYLIKNGVKTPVYKGGLVTNKAAQSSETPWPELSSNPADPVPNKGVSHIENGKIGSILYFSIAPFNISLNDNNKNTYVEKDSDNKTIHVGTYNPKTLERTEYWRVDTSSIVTGNDFSDISKKILIETGKKLLSCFDGTTVTRETYYDKLYSLVQERNGSVGFSQAVTSGWSTADAFGGAMTLGCKMTFKEGGGILPAEAEQEFSAQLSATYNHTITISKQRTDTVTLGLPKADDSYKYNNYVAAIYQLKSRYTPVLGPALQEAINSGGKLDGATFDYDEDSIAMVYTPGAGHAE
ncbi:MULTISPECIES: hypothetical protein [Bacillus]|uniref:Cry55Aa2-like protein n=1 Tax=Bacillus thuringiensis TaxID=1428 RepID=A0A6F7TNF2_BACTU|nr:MULTISPECIES: hypothetical protein [Bacillus cereus group]AEH76827.1 Cry55Aa2-like protein [Bacillus thuringiensis]OTY54887.1 hypothetical protein BK748_16985 [Bacillus thuringiensis serovar graciosensis]KXY68780.1 hypothetical protein AT270_10385 [Bacillus cereus]MBG9937277.1 hypothetical protein [Bacillus tropicus]MBG9937783.1 hypothetical protein [Bacillus tropicus]